MDEHDFYRRALLIIVGRGRRLIQPDDQEQNGCAGEPWQDPRGQREESRGVGEVDQRHVKTRLANLLVSASPTGNQHGAARQELIGINPDPASGWRRPRTVRPRNLSATARTGWQTVRRRNVVAIWRLLRPQRRRSGPGSRAAPRAPQATARRDGALPRAPRRSCR